MARRKIDPQNKLRLRQLMIAPWQGQDGRMTYSLVALGIDGAAYRFEVASGGWVPYSMDVFIKKGE